MARLAVSAVTCRHAAIRMPLSGFCFANRSRIWWTTGIDRPDHSIRPRPFSASARFFTSQGTGADGFFRDAELLGGNGHVSFDLSHVEESGGGGAPAARGGSTPARPRGQVPPGSALVSGQFALLGPGAPACANARVVAPCLVLVAAGRHLAPAASSVPAGVQEQPPASVHGRGLADADARPVGPGEEVRGGQREPGDDRVEPGRLGRDPAVRRALPYGPAGARSRRDGPRARTPPAARGRAACPRKRRGTLGKAPRETPGRAGRAARASAGRSWISTSIECARSWSSHPDCSPQETRSSGVARSSRGSVSRWPPAVFRKSSTGWPPASLKRWVPGRSTRAV